MYGPENMGGRGMRLYKVEQGLKQITTFLRHWRHNSQFGDMLRITVSWFQFSIGTSFSALYDTTTPIPHMEGKWLPSLRGNLQRIQCKLDLDEAYIVPAQRENDRWIMVRVMQSKCFTKTQMEWVNYCRLYLRVTTLSDITRPDGIRIDTAFGTSDRNNTSSAPKHYAIQQDKPGPSAWKQWRRALRLFSKQNGIIRGRRLGRWLFSADTLRQNWHAYIHEASDSLYVRQLSGEYNRIKWNPKSACYKWDSSTCSEFQKARSTPVQVIRTHEGWTIYYSAGQTPKPETPMIYTDFVSYIQKQKGWEMDLFGYVDMLVQPDEIWDRMFSANFALGCSDGSVKKKCSSFAWILGDADQIYVRVAGPVCLLDPTSFRAEAFGILSFLRFALRLCWWLDRPAKLLSKLHSDSESVIKHIQKYRSYHHSNGNATLHSDWDVINKIYHTSKELGFTDPIWVKGHQDEKVSPFAKLSLPAQLNCRADDLANKIKKLHH